MSKSRVFVDVQGKPPRGYKRFARVACERILSLLDFDMPVELSILLTDNKTMRQLNSSYRGIDEPTDVLSFPLDDDGQSFGQAKRYKILGDVVVSVNMAIKQGNENGHSTRYEFAFLLAHGILHLIGYDDVTCDGLEEMKRLGTDIVNKIDADSIE